MSQDSYEYECMRAELLGLPKPEKEPEPARQIVDDDDEDDETDGDVAKELDDRKENLKAVGGGLAELNSILSVTQKKLNSFKPNFGSLKDLFRNLSTDNPGAESKTTETGKVEAETSSEATTAATKKSTGASRRDDDLVQETESQVDKLDKLVMKAEEAEMRMAHQNNQMRRFLH